MRESEEYVDAGCEVATPRGVAYPALVDPISLHGVLSSAGVDSSFPSCNHLHVCPSISAIHGSIGVSLGLHLQTTARTADRGSMFIHDEYGYS